MATYYLDYEGGSDAGVGTSFATRWKTLTTGATAARIAPGDTIRIMGSPAAQSLGINGTWTSSSLAATKSITSSTNASPIVITLASHGYATGDTVVVTGHTTNTKANGTWEIISVTSSTFSLTGSTGNGTGGASGTVRLRNNSRVVLASDIGVKNLASHGNAGSGRTAWTASANVTTSLNTTDFKEGDSSDSIVIDASFTTGKAAYKATPAAITASSCATTSFWIKQTSGTVAVANDVSIRLCSDVAGATSVKTVPVPGLVTLNRWTVVSVDTSGLTGNIQSVALYVDADKGAQTFLICNIVGTNGSFDMDLSSLIGKNTGTGMNAEPWCPIQSINGTRIMLDGDTNLTPISTTLRGYYGTTETVTTYFRKTIKTAITSTSTIVQSITDSGTAGSLITFSGGWDRVAMTGQTLETFFDGQNSQGNGIDLSSKSYVTMDKISCCRYYAGYNASGTFQTISNAQCVACSQASFWLLSNFHQNAVSNCLAGFSSYGFWIYNNANSNRISNIKSVGNQNYGLIPQLIALNNVVTSGNIFNNGVDGININGASLNTFKSVNSHANNSYGIVTGGGSSNMTFINCSASSGNSIGWNMQGYNYLTNCTAVSNTSSQFLSNPGSAGADDGIYSMDHTGVSGNTTILMSSGSVVSTTGVRHTSSGIAWALAPTSSTARTSDYPLTLNIATVAVAANTLVTVKAWLRRTNTGLTLGLRILGDQIAGVSSDVLSPMTAVADTWEEVTLTFTPTVNGVVKIQTYCYGGSTYTGYVDDLTITQALALAAALTPTFGATTSTADGFTVQISNYDSAYTFAGTATASGSVAISGSGLVTVTGVAGNTSSTATITTSRSGYTGGSATVTATSLGSTPVTFAAAYNIGSPASYSVTGTSTVTASVTGAYDGRLWLLINQTGTLTYTVTASSENNYDGGRLYRTASSPASHIPENAGGYNISISGLTNVSLAVSGTGTSTGTVSVTQGHYLVLRYFKDEEVNVGTDSITAIITIT